MKWSMDTHKYISEITRTALKIMSDHNISSESEAEEIEAVERDLAAAGVYKDFEAARGRVRRALFTYFKAYHCLDANEHLTDIGRLYADGSLSIQEFSFYYIVNYIYKDNHSEYYPTRLILSCLKQLADQGAQHAYISAYDFSRIVDCTSMEDVNSGFIDDLLSIRLGQIPVVNERSIGFDVWAKMLVQAGILKRNSDRSLSVANQGLADWILDAYGQPLTTLNGKINSGILKYFPVLPLNNSHGDILPYENEGKALQAFLFDAIDDAIIDKFIFTNTTSTFANMLYSLGVVGAKGFYSSFIGLERLIGFSLAANHNPAIKTVGEILSRIEISTLDLDDIDIDAVVEIDEESRVSSGTNILLYGVPGCGKSWTIEHEYCKPGTNVERLVFHPDYSNADFVGQILPVVDPVDKQVTYEFTPGPFTNILRAAYINPHQRYVLVIEEINRGNAPAIFGDVFQLLDRTVSTKTSDGITYSAGTSEYGITNGNVAKVVYGDETHKVRIPSNLSILGTMNTSDQNVFTLDTAFQRRWRMRLIENDFFNVRTSLAQAEILDTGVTWRRFCETVNEIIIGNKAKIASAEDKRLGVYFVHENELKFDDRAVAKPPHTVFALEYNELLKAEMMNGTPEEAARLAEVREALMQIRIFPEKVIKYLWDDAFKFNPEALFDTDNMDSLEKVIRTFVLSQGRERFKIFRSSVQQKLYPTQQ
ncbi:AAA family ATPase [uncultured Allofournierella sp.]|uniref:AAA family ATPase n=1 Tax=uncultured Allofournierella sp. TaxID=1940258 RepID=UPI003751A5C9